MKTTTIFGLGLIGFVLLAVLTIVLAGGWIEDDLTQRSHDALNTIDQSWAEVAVSGRHVTLTGSAPDADSAKLAFDSVRDVWGVRAVTDEITRP